MYAFTCDAGSLGHPWSVVMVVSLSLDACGQEGYELDEGVVTAAVKACCRAGRSSEAEAVLSKSIQEGFIPEVGLCEAPVLGHSTRRFLSDRHHVACLRTPVMFHCFCFDPSTLQGPSCTPLSPPGQAWTPVKMRTLSIPTLCAMRSSE